MILFQIEAHVGNVSDLAFSHPNKQLCIITCGDDKAIKVCFVIKYVGWNGKAMTAIL